ncbi:type II secretion system F family protein [Roseofilum sp. BLCC_M91]|uniref:Type II secretion system F family protein n=1 Tax=Roseofilum halophilum BLCC-M91 TaxID=3022259 RepID=A0ABT7BQA1_9CYAN|nr:type II secretion system F family protein [Roseofilum halophilum]MDJ1180666.1 type II secretion system F family protein [Roseofilum halophilum BLCC-M91]
MPNFVADVRDSMGNAKRETVKADSLGAARSELLSRGLEVGEVKKAPLFDFANIDFDELNENFAAATASVTVKDKAIFSRQFAAMVNAGVGMVRCLGVLTEQCENPKLKRALKAISAEVQEGSSLSESMGKHPDCYDDLYVAMVSAGEVGGVLDDVLNRLAKLLEDSARLQNQMKSAMSYPTTVGSLAVIIFIALTVFLIPTFAGIFEDIGVELPAFTQMMLVISGFLVDAKKSVTLLVILIVLKVAYDNWYKTPQGKKIMDKQFLKLPLFGDLIKKTATARFCRTFGTLSRAGVPILTSLEIVRDTSGNQTIADAVEASRQEIQGGGMISAALDRYKVFPALAISMISIGEETGQIDQMLMKVADFYEDEVEQAVKGLTSMLEPVMIVVIGGMVGSILLAMYLPMFKVFETM